MKRRLISLKEMLEGIPEGELTRLIQENRKTL